MLNNFYQVEGMEQTLTTPTDEDDIATAHHGYAHPHYIRHGSGMLTFLLPDGDLPASLQTG